MKLGEIEEQDVQGTSISSNFGFRCTIEKIPFLVWAKRWIGTCNAITEAHDQKTFFDLA